MHPSAPYQPAAFARRFVVCILGGIGLAAALDLPAQSSFAQPVAAVPGQDWWHRAPVYRSKYYNVKTDLPIEDARALVAHVDSTFESYVGLFSKLPVRARRPARLDLYLFATQADFLNVLQIRFRDDGTGAWGKCITEGDEISLVGWRGDYSNEQMKQLLQHEGFHQIASHYFRGLPPWANEGLAEVFERGIPIGGQLVLGEFPADRKQRLVEAIDSGQVMPFDRFFAIDGSLWNHQVRTGDPGLNYLQAWSLVHFFLFAEDGRYETAFLTFLLQLNRTQEWQQAFTTGFGVPNFRVIEQKWLDYIRDRPATDYRETARRLDFLAAGMLALHERGIRPDTLAALEAALRDIAFDHETVAFGELRKLNALERAVFTVPGALADVDRRFAVIATGRDDQRSGSQRSSPPNPIALVDIYPQSFAVEWRPSGGSYQYHILSGHEARIAIAAAEKRAAAAARRRRDHREGETMNEPAPDAADADPALQMRTWTTADGRHSTTARLLAWADGTVRLEKEDGSRVNVPYRALSDADQAFVDAWREGQLDGDSIRD